MVGSVIARGVLASLASVLLCASAEAQLFRAYLASYGNYANPCTLQAPCRLLPAALNAVASGGEIWMLDSANYNTGTVTVGKNVSILAVRGVVGSIVALNSGPAISITASNLTISLRNVVIGPVAGATAGTHGVQMTGASSLTIEGCLLYNLPSDGVAAFDGTLKVADTTLRNNGGWAIRLGARAAATVSASHLLNNHGGISAAAFSSEIPPPAPTTATASISGSVISGGSFGVSAYIAYDTAARISVTTSTIEGTTAALRSYADFGTAEITFGNSLIVDNEYAWHQQGAGAAILSLGNNQMSGNAGSYGNLTVFAPQ